MNISGSTYSISEIRDMLGRRDLIVNEDYQRAPRLWPSGPRSYFIDTILSEFPFPKLYFYEFLDKGSRKTKREIVDGQQRVHTIVDFLDDKFALSYPANAYHGNKYSELPSEIQEKLLGYTVSVDVIRNAEKSQILQMFRRMNAYTLPLNEAEKRHSSFFGEFKGFINQLTDKYAGLLSEWSILTKRQMVRMADAEFFAEVVLAFEFGTISTSNKMLSDLYKRYDEKFSFAKQYGKQIEESLQFMISNLNPLRETYLMKSYVVHSLVCAMVHNKFGLPGFQAKTNLAPTGKFCADIEVAINNLKILASAHESRDHGPLKPYVDACSEGSNRETQRTVRVTYLCRALRGEL